MAIGSPKPDGSVRFRGCLFYLRRSGVDSDHEKAQEGLVRSVVNFIFAVTLFLLWLADRI